MPDLGKSQDPAFRKCRVKEIFRGPPFGAAGSRARKRRRGPAAELQGEKSPFSFQVCFFMIILGADVLDSVLDQKFSTSKTARPEIQYF